MIQTAILGLAAGALVGVLAARWRRRGLAATYGLVAASLLWAASAIIAGNRADGMGGLPYLAAGGALFWFVSVPAGAAALVLELRRAGRL